MQRISIAQAAALGPKAFCRWPVNRATAVALYVLASPWLANAATITSFDVSGANCTGATGINAGGTIAGYYYVTNPDYYGFVRTPDGTITTFGDVGTLPWAINVHGWIAGDVGVHSFVRSADGTITTFDVGIVSTHARAINNGGSIAGSYCDTAVMGFCTQLHAYVRAADGTVTKFDTSETTYVAGINGSGSITGTSDGHGFLRSPDGTTATFDVDGSTSTWPAGINNDDSVAGYWYDSNNAHHGFVRVSDGTITTFDVPKSLETGASDINKKGEIAGGYTDDFGVNHGFVRTVSERFNKFDPVGAVETDPTSINNSRAVTGLWLDGNKACHGFVRIP